jgi:hypothetical protein
MKRTIIPFFVAVAAMTLLTGCVGGVQLGGGTKSVVQPPTVGQQLVDLKKAKDAGALSDEEYQAQKAKILAPK